ncbi:hypothetical protein HDE70_000943 [Pedobacter cryoconitis]|nr:hypothetical protein [Pedobacter cryoconitis]
MRMRLNVKLISGFILHKKELTAISAKDEQFEQKKDKPYSDLSISKS